MVAIAWDASTDNHRIGWYEAYGEIPRTRVRKPSLTVDRLPCGESFAIWIAAFDKAGNRSPEALVTVATQACRDTTAPTTPTNLRQSAASENAVVLVWDPSGDDTGVVGYGVYRHGALTTVTKEPAATMSGLACGSVHGFEVDAVDAAGNRSPRGQVWAQTADCAGPPPGDTTPPTQPGALAVSAATQTSVSLTWNASSDAVGVTGYGVYRGSTLATTVPTPGATVSGLTCGTGYTFSVDAYDAAGNRSGKASVTGTTAACSTPPPGDTTPPTQPGALAVSAATRTSVSLTWNASSDAVGVTGYGVYRGSTLATTVPTPGATVSGLTCGTGYTFSVDAYDAAGNRSGKATVTGTTAACATPPPNDTTPPTAPSNVQPSTRTATSIALTWSASSDNIGVTGYGVYRAGTLVGSPSATTYIVSGLTCNTNYTLAVDAFDAAGNRSTKTTVMVATTACPDTTPPSAPTGLAVSGISQTGATLAWSASSDNVGVAGYDVYAQGSKVTTTSSTNHTYGSLTCGTSYTLGVVAFDAAGNRSSQATTTMTTSACSTPPPTGGNWPASFLNGPAGTNNILPSRQGVLVGIWDSGANGTDRIKLRESQVGRKFDIGAGSYGTGDPANFDGKLTLIKNEGRIPLASMHSNQTIAQINAGSEDEWHRASARAVKALGVPTFVRLFHEFNGDWMRYYTPGDTPADGQAFISAWRRVVSLWKGEGANNAVFIWAPAFANGANAQVRYPGDAWVDWIGNSSYTSGPQQWVGFYQDYADLWQLLAWGREYKTSDPGRYNDLRYKPLIDSFNKPFMIGEMGHFEDERKAQWFRNTKANLTGTFEPAKQNGGFASVLAILASDYGREADPNGEEWTLDKPASALAGFRDMVNDPYFKTRG
jgi:chitodextrinase